MGATPRFLGKRLFKNFDLAELETYIDWGPFFQTWDLAGPFPAILKDEVVGAEAQRVFSDGKRMLKRLVEGRWLNAHAVVGLYPANSMGDDLVLWTDETRTQRAMTWCGLRQQTEKPVHDGVQNPNRCLRRVRIAHKTHAQKDIFMKLLKMIKFWLRFAKSITD
jgi:5-methyltetrahydrofolate--homocysteine methyltransferase